MRWRPRAVTWTDDTAEVAALLRLANRYHLPVVPVSGNTNLVKETTAEGALMLSINRLSEIGEMRPAVRVVSVRAGRGVIEVLNAALAAHDLMFPQSFGARGSTMVGGVFPINAGGARLRPLGADWRYLSGLPPCLHLPGRAPPPQVRIWHTSFRRSICSVRSGRRSEGASVSGARGQRRIHELLLVWQAAQALHAEGRDELVCRHEREGCAATWRVRSGCDQVLVGEPTDQVAPDFLAEDVLEPVAGDGLMKGDGGYPCATVSRACRPIPPASRRT